MRSRGQLQRVARSRRLPPDPPSFTPPRGSLATASRRSSITSCSISSHTKVSQIRSIIHKFPFTDKYQCIHAPCNYTTLYSINNACIRHNNTITSFSSRPDPSCHGGADGGHVANTQRHLITSTQNAQVPFNTFTLHEIYIPI